MVSGMFKSTMLLTTALILLAAEAVAAPSGFGSFDKVADVPLGEKTSRFDYQSLDPATGRLAVSKMGSGKLLLFDARNQKLISELPGFPKTTGVLMVPELRKRSASLSSA